MQFFLNKLKSTYPISFKLGMCIYKTEIFKKSIYNFVVKSTGQPIFEQFKICMGFPVSNDDAPPGIKKQKYKKRCTPLPGLEPGPPKWEADAIIAEPLWLSALNLPCAL